MTNQLTIPFFNYPALFKENENEFVAIFKDVCTRGAYILQKDLFDFEENLKSFLKVKHVFGVADGTNAIILGLKALDIGPGDEVIVPSHTYIASAASVALVGAKPILCDIGYDNLIDPVSVESKITKKTKAIMPVHVNGRTCTMAPLEELAKKYDLMIVEDAAQALGSKYKEKSAGTFGKFGTFSFYPAKVLGCFGDGGAIVTNDDEVANQLSILRDHGRDENGRVISWGTNSRLDNLQAAFLNFKLKTFDQDILKRREIARQYHEAFVDIKEIDLPPGPDTDSQHFDIYQNYEMAANRRDELKSYLQERGISTIIQWAGTPVHHFKELGFNDSLPETEKFFKRCLMLPMNVSLNNIEVEYVIDSVRSFYKK
ncbi:MAG: DegT/DnrJ/EryC1/StrS family aminotransferase [Alphaproteobacteria bacterium]|nr:DegT/DnrJ/EryC1/StrS family aminotransferase [Alphaproteobacteria bacterium]